MSFISRSLSTAIPVAASFALAACAMPGSPAPSGAAASQPATPAGAVCNAAPVQSMIGRMASASVVEEARQKSGALMARVLRPDQVVTMEFNAQRLNLSVDATSKVIRVNCG